MAILEIILWVIIALAIWKVIAWLWDKAEWKKK